MKVAPETLMKPLETVPPKTLLAVASRMKQSRDRSERAIGAFLHRVYLSFELVEARVEPDRKTQEKRAAAFMPQNESGLRNLRD